MADFKNPLVLSALCAAASVIIWFFLGRFGTTSVRSWAVPAAAGTLCGGVGYAFHLNPLITIVALFASLHFLHRSAAQRQTKAASSIRKIQADEGRIVLEISSEKINGAAAVWLETRSAASAGDAAAAESAPMIVSVGVAGDDEDEFQVVVSARVDIFPKGMMFIHHADCSPDLKETMADEPTLSGLEGKPESIVVKAKPVDFAFEFLDMGALSRISEIFSLRGKGAELVVHAGGPELRVVSNVILEGKRLESILSETAALADRQRRLGRLERLS